MTPERPAIVPPGLPPEPDAAARISELVRRAQEQQHLPAPTLHDGPRTEPVPTVEERWTTELPPVVGSEAPADAPAQTVTPEPLPVAPAPVAPAPAKAPRRPPGTRRALLAAGAAVVLLLAAVVAALVVHGSSAGSGDNARGASSATSGALTGIPGGYTVRAHDTVTDCAAHSRGAVREALRKTPCTNARRWLATGTVSGRPVLYVVSQTTMPSPQAAAAVKQELDGSGTGNIDDLLREGNTYAGAPARMPSSGYASVQSGNVVTVAEAGYTDGGASSSSSAALRAAAAEVASALVSSERGGSG